MVDTSINKEKYCSLITERSDSLTPDIIFIPTHSGGYYVDRAKATIVARGGYGRLEFELNEHEIAQLEEGELEVWGDEADLVFPNVQADWVSWVKGLPSITNRFQEWLFEYWCHMSEDDDVIEKW